MTYSTIFDLDGNTIGDDVAIEINTARRIAADHRRSVVVEDRGTEECYRVTPAGHIWRAPKTWPTPSWDSEEG